MKKCLLFIFLSTFLFSFWMQMSADTFSSQYDPYFHAIQGVTAFTKMESNLPIYSTSKNVEGGLWYFYHKGMYPFVKNFDGNNYDYLLRGVKLYHSLLLAIFSSVFYLITYKLLYYYSSIKKDRIPLIASLSVFSLFALSLPFLLRMMLQRPHVLSISAFLVATYMIVRKNNWGLFFIALVYPFIYTTSFLLLIPGLVYVLASTLFYKIKNISLDWFIPLGMSVIGLGAGILIRPTSLDYLYNAYYVHILSLGARFVTNLPVPGEFSRAGISFRDWLWFTPLVLILGLLIIRMIDTKKIPKSISYEQFFLFTLTTCLFLLFILVQRAVEYFIPVAIIFLVLFMFEFIFPKFRSFVNKEYDQDKAHPVALFFSDTAKELFDKDSIKKIKYAVSTVIVTYFIANVGFYVNQLNNEPNYMLFSNTAHYLEEHSDPGDVVFNASWGEYPRLLFFNQSNRYIMGNDPMFTYTYDKEKFWLWYHSISTEHICAERTCLESTHTLYDVVKDDFNSRYIFINEKEERNKEERNYLQEKIEADERIRLVFEDTEAPNLQIFLVD